MTQLASALIETSLLLTWVVLFIVIAAAGEIGYRLGWWRSKRETLADAERTMIGTLVAAMVTLLAFGLGLAISFAHGRFEQRRDLVVQEANAIGTAWLRAGLFDTPEGPALRHAVERYARLRLDYLLVTDHERNRQIIEQTSVVQTEIWRHTQTIARARPDPIAASLVASVNDVFDLSMSERFSFANRVPVYLIWAVLWGSVLSIGAMQYQFGVARRRHPFLKGLLLFMWTGAIMVIVDLNRPRLGELRVDPAPLIWTLQGFGVQAP